MKESCGSTLTVAAVLRLLSSLCDTNLLSRASLHSASN